jgi:hypothetical protein
MIGNISKGNMLYQKEQGYNQTRNEAVTQRRKDAMKGQRKSF